MRRVVSRFGYQVAKNRSAFISALVVIVLAAGLFAIFGHGKVSLTNPFAQHASQAEPDCAAKVINLIAKATPDVSENDLSAAHACLTNWPPVSNMTTDAQFARFADSNAPRTTVTYERVGKSSGVTANGKAYNLTVYILHDGYPDTTLVIFTDESDQVVHISGA